MSYRDCLLASVLMVTALCGLARAQGVASESRHQGADSDGKSVVAALRDGTTIELVAVIRVRGADDIAWQPDGSRTEISDAWPEVLSVKAEKPTHGFIFRFEGLKPGQGIGWDAPLTTPHPGEPLKGLASASGSFSETQTTDIRVGVLDEWGPWQPTEADGSIASRVTVAGPVAALYRSINSLSVMGKSKPLVAFDRKEGSQPLASLAECEIVAVDSQSERHRRKGVGVWEDKQAPFFDLAKIDLQSFEFRLRPYTQWVEFKNVPLEPAVSGVEVSVTKPRP